MSKVLVLDQTWRPSRIIDIKRAVLLLLSGKAVPVTDTPVGVMRSPSTEISVPSVIQVSAWAWDNYFKQDVSCTRARVMTRDGNECQFVVNENGCKQNATTIDHLLPRSRGGQDTWENLVAACHKHNSVKDDRTLEEMAKRYGWALKREPVAPKFMVRMLNKSGAINPDWLAFMPEMA